MHFPRFVPVVFLSAIATLSVAQKTVTVIQPKLTPQKQWHQAIADCGQSGERQSGVGFRRWRNVRAHHRRWKDLEIRVV